MNTAKKTKQIFIFPPLAETARRELYADSNHIYSRLVDHSQRDELCKTTGAKARPVLFAEAIGLKPLS